MVITSLTNRGRFDIDLGLVVDKNDIKVTRITTLFEMISDDLAGCGFIRRSMTSSTGVILEVAGAIKSKTHRT